MVGVWPGGSLLSWPRNVAVCGLSNSGFRRYVGLSGDVL